MISGDGGCIVTKNIKRPSSLLISVEALEYGKPHRLKLQILISLASGGCEEPCQEVLLHNVVPGEGFVCGSPHGGEGRGFPCHFVRH